MNILQALGFVSAPTPQPVKVTASHRPKPKPNYKRKPKANARFGSDLIGVIGFNSSAFYISLPAPPWADKLGQRIRSLPNRLGGRTNTAAALRMALAMSRKCPRGSRRRIWLLSDGWSNENTHDTIPAAQAIAAARINLNTIGFGEAADSDELKLLAAQTHNGKFVSVSSMRQMADALKRGTASRHQQTRQEVAIIVVDLSASMQIRDMGSASRIEAVRDAIHDLCTYKATTWS